MKCQNTVFICVSGTKNLPDLFTQNFPEGPQQLGACCTIIFVPVTQIYFPGEAHYSLGAPSPVKGKLVRGT